MEPGTLFSGSIQCESVKLPPPEARVPKSGVFYENDGLLPTAERAVNGYRGDAANAEDRVDFIPLQAPPGWALPVPPGWAPPGWHWTGSVTSAFHGSHERPLSRDRTVLARPVLLTLPCVEHLFECQEIRATEKMKKGDVWRA